jgi:hypothetical protein
MQLMAQLSYREDALMLLPSKEGVGHETAALLAKSTGPVTHPPGWN